MTATTDPVLAALLRDVLANPGDDTPRLVYADRLDDHGDHDRAEFIRVQCELARHPGMNCGQLYCSERGPEGLCDSCLRFKRLRRRERDLWHRLDPLTFGLPEDVSPLLGQTHPNSRGPEAYPRRGFFEVVRCPAGDWLAHADAITDAHPITDVSLTRLGLVACGRIGMMHADRFGTRTPGQMTARYGTAPTTDHWKDMLSDLWGGRITFHLPPA